MKINADLSFLNNTNKPDIIKGHIYKIAELVYSELKEFSPTSIILTGSASHGDIGIVTYKNNYVPYGDYDFAVCCKSIPPGKTLEILQWKINKTVFGGTDRTRGPLVDIKVYPENRKIRFNCDLAAYDTLSTYKIIWGKDIFKNATLPINDVPPVSMFRILMNRFSHLTISISSKHGNTKPDDYTLIDIEKNIVKTFIELGGALAYIMNKYTADIKKRLDIVTNNEIDTDFNEKLDLLRTKIKIATHKKLFPARNTFNNWFSERLIAGTFTLKILLILLEKCLKTSVEQKDIETIMLSKLATRYFSPYLIFEARRLIKLPLPPAVANLLSIGANIYERFKFYVKNRQLFKLFGGWQSPIVIYYWIIIKLFIHSQNRENIGLDKNEIEEIQVVTGAKKTLSNWEDVRCFAKKIWQGYAGRTW